MRRRFGVLLAGVMAAALIGCGSGTPETTASKESTAADTTAAATTAAPETTMVDAGSSGETEMTGGSLETAASATEYADDTLKQVYAAVKEAYGENYLPNMALEEQMLADSWGVDMTLVDGAYFAEVPMISAHVDTFAGFKAKSGEAEKLAESLKGYQTYLQKESLQYPMNEGIVSASQVVTYGDYVFFLMLTEDNTPAAEAIESILK